MSTELQKVKAVKDDDGHWYIIPNDLVKDFYEELEKGESDEWGKFNGIFSGYRTGGDLNLVQLYAEI